MRYVLILILLLFIGLTVFSNTPQQISTAYSKTEIVCKNVGKGDMIYIEAGQPLSNLSVEDVCSVESLPAGWKISCYSNDGKGSYVISFVENGRKMTTEVLCT